MTQNDLQTNLTPRALLAIGDVPRIEAVNAITCAWLGAQKKTPSAGSTLKFIRDLGKALNRGT